MYDNMENMQTSGGTTPKDFFLYLAAAFTLYFSAGSLMALLFGIIEATTSTAQLYGIYGNSGLRFAIASIVVVFPLYLVFTWLIRKSIVNNPAKSNIWVRRWFIFITLFIAGGTIAGDLIATINEFLGGEFAGVFVLKALAVFVVAAAVFSYYIYDLKRRDQSSVEALLYLELLPKGGSYHWINKE